MSSTVDHASTNGDGGLTRWDKRDLRDGVASTLKLIDRDLLTEENREAVQRVCAEWLPELNGLTAGQEQAWAQRARGWLHKSYEVRFEIPPGGKLQKLTLPEKPAAGDTVGCCFWLTEVFSLDRAHPITDGAHEGLRGANGHVVLERRGAPPIRFEPASHVNTAVRLIEDLSWQKTETDRETYGFKSEHTHKIAHVIRMLCGATKGMSDKQETCSIVATFLDEATVIEGHTTYGGSGHRYEAALALQRPVDATLGRPIGAPRHLIDTNTGEIVVRVSDLATSVRRQLGTSLRHGWLDARMQNLGWARATLQGYALPGRAGRNGPHQRADIYRGHLPDVATEDIDEMPRQVNT